MIDYKKYVQDVIARGDYILANIEQRIDKLWIEGKLTDSERETLLQSAADGAKDVLQVDVLGKIAQLERDVWELKHPVDQYEIWKAGKSTNKGEIVRYDVTGDGELDLCQYNGGRAYTSLSIGKIEGWNLLDRELNIVATITRDAEGGYVVTPIPEPEPPEPEPTEEEPSEEPTEPTEEQPTEPIKEPTETAGEPTE